MQKTLHAHADVFSCTRGLNFGPSLHLHPHFVYASSSGSGESANAQTRRSLHYSIQTVKTQVKCSIMRTKENKIFLKIITGHPYIWNISSLLYQNQNKESISIKRLNKYNIRFEWSISYFRLEFQNQFIYSYLILMIF